MMVRIFPLLLLMISMIHCKDSAVNLCDDLRKGLVDHDLEIAKPAFESMLLKYDAEPTPSDPVGHEQNIHDFIDQLNDKCSLEAMLVCYACIETFPEQSEVRILVDSSGTVVSRIIDIVNSEKLIVRDIHL